MSVADALKISVDDAFKKTSRRLLIDAGFIKANALTATAYVHLRTEQGYGLLI